MTCEETTRSLALMLYGELSFDEEEELQSHIDACPSCRDAVAKERAVHNALDERDMEVSPFLLRRVRQQLGERLAVESDVRRRGFLGSLSSLFSGPGWTPRFVRPAGAVALVAAGFFAAQVMPVWRAGVASAGLVDPNTAKVRFVETGDNGRVQIAVEETRQRVISGRLDDEPIRKLLLAAAKDPTDPGLRAESVEILRSRMESDDVRGALLNALMHDSNAGVRLKALGGLKPYAGHPEVRKALSQVLLHDDNPGVRTQAIDMLTQNNREEQMVGLLQELLRKEQNNYVRDRCERVLRDLKASTETY